jgi:hypothetical protein
VLAQVLAQATEQVLAQGRTAGNLCESSEQQGGIVC